MLSHLFLFCVPFAADVFKHLYYRLIPLSIEMAAVNLPFYIPFITPKSQLPAPLPSNVQIEASTDILKE